MILAIDTSAAISVAVVAPDGKVLVRRSEFAPRGHAELLTSLVEGCLSEAAVARADRIVVGTGPAPFTGLRVGIVTARTLAYAWNVPIDGVCSLDALAVGVEGACTVVADARRKEVYWATYVDGVRTSGPHVSAPSEVDVHGEVRGRGALLYPEVFPKAVPGDPDPAALVTVADAARAAGAHDLSTEPLYLRRPDVHGA